MPTNSMIQLSQVLFYILIETVLLFIWVRILGVTLPKEQKPKKKPEKKLRGDNYPFDEGTEITWYENY